MINQEEYFLRIEEERKNQVNDLADYLKDFIKLNANIRDMKLNSVPSDELLEKIKNYEIPKKGRDSKEIAKELTDDVFSKAMLIQHPRFFSFVASAVSPYSLAGAILTDIYNIHGGGFEEAPAACAIEEKLIKWMASLAGYPEETCGGIFTSGGSMSTLTALTAARDKILKGIDISKGVAYISDQTHSSVIKGLRITGIRDSQVRKIPTDDEFKIRLDILEDTIKEDIKAGLKPYVIVGTMGTTNTGSIDPLLSLSTLRDKYGTWLHVDGAYGGSILLSDIYRNLSAGIERSDSFSWDTHKWAMQTYSCSSVIVRDKNDLLNSFSEHPEYLEDIRNKEHDDPWDLGPELTRPHRSIKFWYTIQALGTDKLADIVDYSFYNCKVAYKMLLENPLVEITSKPSCAAITFRYAPKNIDESRYDELNAKISQKILDDQYCFVVTTVVKNKKVLRLCFVNGNTTTKDVISSIEYMNGVAKDIINVF